MSGLVRLICRKEQECRVFDILKVEAANVKKRLLKTEWVIEDEIAYKEKGGLTAGRLTHADYLNVVKQRLLRQQLQAQG